MRKWLTGLIVFVLALPIIGDAQMPSTLVRMSTGSGTADSGTQRVILASDSPSGEGVAQGSTTSGQTGSLVQGAVTTSAPSYSTGQTSPLSLTTAGLLRVVESGSTIDPTIAAVTYTSAQTNATLIAAPAAGNRIVVVGVWVNSSVTANVSVLIGFHATVTPATGSARVFKQTVSTTGGGWKQLGGTAVGVGGDAVPLLITTGTIADGDVSVDVHYIVEAVP